MSIGEGNAINRVIKSKIQYISLIIIGIMLCLFLVLVTAKENRFIFVLLMLIILLIPGRLQGYYYRNFFIARRLLSEKKYSESIEHNEAFIADLKNHKWKKRLIWLNWSIYSRDIEAMALNNMGAAFLGLHKFDFAENFFKQALAVDFLYPLPYYNLSLLAAINKDKEAAAKLYETSKELGYSGTTFDSIIKLGQQILANVEGR